MEETRKTEGNKGKQRKTNEKMAKSRKPKEADIRNLTPPLGGLASRSPGSYLPPPHQTPPPNWLI